MAESTHMTTGDGALPKRWAAVLNEQSGTLLGQDDPGETVRTLFAQAGLAVDLVAPDHASLPERIEQAFSQGAGGIIVAGGDGTVACAAQKLAGTGIALGIIPGGTMNLLAKDLALPAGDMKAAIDHLVHGRLRAIDVGMVGEHVFLCGSMLGTPARLSRHREAGRRQGNGLLAWAGFGRAAWRALRQNATMRLTIVCNGQTMRVRSPSVTITVNPLDDEQGRLFGRSCLDGGKLAVYIVRPSTPFRQAKLLLRTLVAGDLDDPEIRVIHTDAVEIRSRLAALHVLVDGEARLLPPPLRYAIRPRALCVVVPAAEPSEEHARAPAEAPAA